MIKGTIEPGKGFQYTPKTTISWADEFNQLLNNYSSRNDLVSKLIEEGLRAQKSVEVGEDGLFLPLDGYSDEQIALLKTPEVQQFLRNFVSLIIENPAGAAFVSQLSGVQPSVRQKEPETNNHVIVNQEPTTKIVEVTEVPKSKDDSDLQQSGSMSVFERMMAVSDKMNLK
ncbi:hypothetical protein [Peribacillus asahii]|uniref:hypothetical protein n=1 Tax=Peribacillus asahii TaxID=228899 RepID=UPI002079DFCB|nr:hypothetical protein [Peribacillus asahii]USK62316.1 hypothetical protein LIT37_24390 [Peribacillus asahii]